ncbi:hypothetical protein [Cecembia sp.]|uniref:hypothetical protein n=1 Tax=Cecembia sp. TaxID=1898110 RepID=UPI0025C39070|nr:hypothetical protein [Cecembia sp.]
MGTSYRKPIKIFDKQMGLKHQVDITGAFGIEIPKYLPVQSDIRHFPLNQVNTQTVLAELKPGNNPS